jgi:protein SCO1/2
VGGDSRVGRALPAPILTVVLGITIALGVSVAPGMTVPGAARTVLAAAAGSPTASRTAEDIAPDFTLVNQDGRAVSLRQLRGKIVLMNFIYTHCTDICPLAEAKLAKVQDDLKARGWFGTRAVFISMTFDPRRDTPAVLKTYSKRFRADLSGWQFLTGAPPVISGVLKTYQMSVREDPKTGLFEHALPMLVIDQRGVILGHYEPDFTPANVTRDLTKLLGG